MKSLTTVFLFAALASPLSAAIIVTGNVSTPNAPCTFEITSDINVTITANAVNQIVAVMFDNWVTTDGTRTDRPLSPGFSYQLNGIAGSQTATLGDNIDNTFGIITPGDGFIFLQLPTPAVIGDILTLKAGVYNFTGDAAFNPQTVGTFNGNLVVIDNLANPIAAPTAVPEPSGALLGLVGAALLFRRRR
ncbi:hypothetical protein JIN84_01240 [Luteolibacter yonseiensis]|uniref:PEP-CTERM protein-sorting domain-containing protein n=1 Tax=Luteolibacter yonseiensis TaxID=1144680 RepID=A0A934R0H5_9BACT|nr:hypothetical protein [Luteolibacter yonseiensis]MBK1814232.1 hypothetical protein [Luteolibacter yonseiensis]